jgi:hypothetical protein
VIVSPAEADCQRALMKSGRLTQYRSAGDHEPRVRRAQRTAAVVPMRTSNTEHPTSRTEGTTATENRSRTAELASPPWAGKPYLRLCRSYGPPAWGLGGKGDEAVRVGALALAQISRYGAQVVSEALSVRLTRIAHFFHDWVFGHGYISINSSGVQMSATEGTESTEKDAMSTVSMMAASGGVFANCYH